MIVLIIAAILLVLTALVLYSTNNLYNIFLTIFLISGIGYLMSYRY